MEKELIIFIVITCIAIISPATAIIALFSFYKRKMLEKETKIMEVKHEKQIESYKLVVEAEEREREKIAKNLHDGILPVLSVIKSSIDMNAEDYAIGKYNQDRMLRDIKALEESIIEIRGVSHDLAPPTLATKGFIKVFENYGKYAAENARTQITFEDRTVGHPDLLFSKTEQHNMYRICLELFQNLQKYSHYTRLQILISNSNKKLLIEFIHDGKGINNADIENLTKSSSGHGLRSLKSRVLILNAELDYSFDEHTSGIVLSIPIPAKAAALEQKSNFSIK